MGQRIPVTLGSIAPLAIKPFRPGKLALVYEGGGQRGVFIVGVLDESMRVGSNPSDPMLGISAGVQNPSAYMCNQQDYARRAIIRYTISYQFFDPMRFVCGGNLIDLDWLVEATSQQVPLAMNYAEAQFVLGKELWLCVCRGDDYSASYSPPTPQTWLDLIRASSAISGFYRSGVLLDGASYLDGGVSDAIPVQEVARHGAQAIVVIRTVPSQMLYVPQWFERMERWLGESSLQPLVNLVHYHENTYRAIQQFIEKPLGKPRIFEIYPQRPLRSMVFGSRLPALLGGYKTGRQCGCYFLATVGKPLADQLPLLRHAPCIARPVPVVVSSVSVVNEASQATVILASQANDASFDREDLA